MTINISRRAGIAGFSVLALVVLLIPIVRHVAADSGVLEACINPGNGMMRLVDSGTQCHNNETRVQWNVTGPQGPQGPVGPQGPIGPQGPAGSSSGGAPFVWICTPASYPNSGGNPRHDVYVFNGSSSTATVSVNILDINGNNLQGHNVPGTNPVTQYTGQADGDSVSLSPAHTLDVNWQSPTTSQPDSDGTTDVAFSVRVTSDQPIVVGHDFRFNDFTSVPCSLLPK